VWGVGQQAVTGEELLRRVVDPVDDVGMDLAQANQRPRVAVGIHCSQRPQQESAIFVDGGMGVVFGITEVESMSAVCIGCAATPGAEPMNQPANTGEGVRAQQAELFVGRIAVQSGHWG